MKNCLVVFLLIFFIPVFGQQNYSYKKKQTTQKGSIYVYWGYNRSAYTKSDIELTGPGYDFTIRDAVSKDNPVRGIANYFDSNTFLKTQFNGRIGYYYKEKFDISIGYDQMNYLMSENQTARLIGEIDSSANSNLAGNYVNNATQLNPQDLGYETRLNYMSAQIQHTNYFFRSKNRKHFLQYRYGLGLGAVLTGADFVWNSVENTNNLSLSGFGTSVHLGLRADFFNRVFLQASSTLGYINLIKVNTIPLSDHRADQQFIFANIQFGAGFFLYKRVKNGCSSCPDWD